MSDFFHDHPLLILAVFIGNSLWVSLLCYCGLRYWIAKHYSSGNDVAVVTQYIIESQPTNNPQQAEEPFSGIRNIIIVERASSIGSSASNSVSDRPFVREEAPPKYTDIFPSGSSDTST